MFGCEFEKVINGISHVGDGGVRLPSSRGLNSLLRLELKPNRLEQTTENSIGGDGVTLWIHLECDVPQRRNIKMNGGGDEGVLGIVSNHFVAHDEDVSQTFVLSSP